MWIHQRRGDDMKGYDDICDAVDDIYAVCSANGLNIEVSEDGRIEIWSDTHDMADVVFGTPSDEKR